MKIVRRTAKMVGRRVRALERLEHQLLTGKKPGEEGLMLDLQPIDIKRIEKEIGVLKSRM